MRQSTRRISTACSATVRSTRSGRGCGGNFRYTENGIKDCSGCLFPHRRENYDRVIARFMEIVKKMQEGE